MFARSSRRRLDQHLQPATGRGARGRRDRRDVWPRPWTATRRLPLPPTMTRSMSSPMNRANEAVGTTSQRKSSSFSRSPRVQLLDACSRQLDANRLCLEHPVVVVATTAGRRDRAASRAMTPAPAPRPRADAGRRRRPKPDAIHGASQPAAQDRPPEGRPAIGDRRIGSSRQPREDLLAADLAAPPSLLPGADDDPSLRHGGSLAGGTLPAPAATIGSMLFGSSRALVLAPTPTTSSAAPG